VTASISGASLVGWVVRTQRRPLVVMVGLLTLAGALEGLGIAALLPVVQGIDPGDASTPSGPGAVATGLLRSLGLPASLGALLTAVVVVFALKAVVLYVAGLQVGRIVARVEMGLFMKLLRSLARAEWRHVAAYPTGFIANAVSAETGRAGNAIYMLAQAFAGAIIVGVYIVLALLVSWRIAISAIAAGVSILFALRGRIGASRAAALDQARLLRAIMARITDALPSFKPLRAMAREAYLLSRLEAYAQSFLEARIRGIAAAEALGRAREPLLVAMIAAGLWLAATLTLLDAATTLVLAFLFLRTVASITGVRRNGCWLPPARRRSNR
jgi:ABC-type multidrug transport system fused ATPase/permease subunit